RISRLLESAFDAGAQVALIERLLDEIQSARFHGLYRHRHVAIARDHDGGQSMVRMAQMLQQFEAAHSRQVCVDQQTGLSAWMIGFEERLAGREILDGASVRLERLAESVAYMTIVIDNIDDRPEIVGRFAEMDWWDMLGRSRRWKEALDGLGQLFQPYGLVEVDAVVTGNIAQRGCRYVAGQDNGRDPTMKLRAQLLNNLKSIQALRQIIVRKN